MKRQSLPILLILMMLITPIASAFEHCTGSSDHLSVSHLLSDGADADADEEITSLSHKKILTVSVDMDCQSSSNCTTHVCGACDIPSSMPTINTVISSYYATFEYVASYDTVLSPDLRPPKIIL